MVLGDVHGQQVELISLLLDSGIVDDDLHWIADDAQLWFLGDLVDRGPDGIGVINLIMGLEQTAPDTGGAVSSLLGNHDLLLLMAHRFGDSAVSDVTHQSFLGEWLMAGGRRADLAGLSPERAAWMSQRPAMALVSNRLLIHSDSLWYLDYGSSISDVNAAVESVLSGDDPVEWDRLLGAISTRFAFDDQRGGSIEAVETLLAAYGGTQVIHGHSPIPLMANRLVEDIDIPLVYADGLAVNVDGGMYLGGAGVILIVRDD